MVTLTLILDTVPAFGKYHLVATSNGQIGGSVAWCSTETEALAAKRAFELVLAPRFTRDEAIQVALTARAKHCAEFCDDERRRFDEGARCILEALAAAGVFVDSDVTIHDQSGNGNDLVGPTMADKLDAAGIR